MEINLMDFIIEQALILVPAIWIIGMFLKSTPKIYDWTIPWILLVCGITGSIFLLGINVQAVLQGILCTGMAVLGHQLFKQTKNKN